MRKVGLFLFAVVATLSVSAGASAQKIGAIPKQLMIVNPKVQTELKLTDAQKKSVTQILGETVTMGEGGRMQIRFGPGTNLDEMGNDLKKLLNADQEKRLQEVWIQREGALALADADVAKALGLNADQKKRADAISEDMRDEIRDAAMASGGRLGPEQSKEIRDRASKKMLALMDAGQKAKFEGMKGKPFKLN